MFIPPNPKLYKDFQKNLAGLQSQQLTTAEREALEARLQLQKHEAPQRRSIFGIGLRLIGWIAGLLTRSGSHGAQSSAGEGKKVSYP